ncbi:hypothetical protein D5086_024349 [Populus alba]|uniref:Uncharacterized protein n=1 Tax=Populus alba TaxID=43335 RepID=A0ACC4B5W1_POPAL
MTNDRGGSNDGLHTAHYVTTIMAYTCRGVARDGGGGYWCDASFGETRGEAEVYNWGSMMKGKARFGAVAFVRLTRGAGMTIPVVDFWISIG